ncbi:MAG: hypothetical protein HY912_11260 [Desulfomonile tiedjei]|uniref:Uncharacterized protein n=1 Tax=Desulfomonile tiedjei TaxID=2358 RepID=A0A9D6Z3Z7_9BACT|nr:hypothetical protein [Desulfomonile tiedjei]
MSILRRLSLTYAAGSFGGLANALAVWIIGYFKIAAAAGVNIAPDLTASTIYPRVVWGGLWGFMFLLPFFRNSPLLRGIIFGLVPALVALFVVFPAKAQNALLGLHLGTMTPLFVVIYNIVWGLAASYWLHRIEEKGRIWRS